MILGVDFGDITAFLRVVVGVVLILGIAPMVLLPRPAGARNGLDAWVANFVRWCAVLIVLVHVLAGTRALSRVSLLVCVLAVAWFTRYRRQFGGFSGVLHLLYAGGPKRTVAPTPGPTRRERLALVALALPPVVLFVVAYLLRARDAFGTYALSPPDAYIHMSWANSMLQGELWVDGVYPQGLAALVAAVYAFTPFTDLLDVARFMGPMVTTFLVFTIYYAVVRLTRQPGAALFAAGTIGLFGALPEWRHLWERSIGLLPQEFALAIAICALVFAVLAVTERGGGRMLRLGAAGGLAMNGNILSLALAGFVAAMTHPVSAAWLGVIVGASAIAATLVSGRWSQLVGAGVATVAGVGLGIAVVPLAELFGVSAYIGYGASEALSDLRATNAAAQQEELLRHFGALSWLEHNWLSRLAMVTLVGAVVGIAVLVVRRDTRGHAAQMLGLTAAAGVTVLLFDLTPIAHRLDAWYVSRLATLIGPTLPLAFGAGLGGLAFLVGRRVSYVRLVALGIAGAVALGAFAWQIERPAQAMGVGFEREEIEYDEMTRATLRLKRDFDAGTYTVVGPTSLRQVLGDHGWSIEQWVFARDVHEVAHDDFLPVPTSDVFVFVELDPLPVREISQNSPVAEYYFNVDKRGRIQAILYEWAETRRRLNPDTTIHRDGEHVRVYRVTRNPAIQVGNPDELFTDYRWRRGELFNDGPTSPRELEPRFAGVDVPDFEAGDEPVSQEDVLGDDASTGGGQ